MSATALATCSILVGSNSFLLSFSVALFTTVSFTMQFVGPVQLIRLAKNLPAGDFGTPSSFVALLVPSVYESESAIEISVNIVLPSSHVLSPSVFESNVKKD